MPDVMGNEQSTTNHDGAVHAELEGASSRFRFRPERLRAEELGRPTTCSFTLRGQKHRCRVLDLAPTGLGLQPLRPIEGDGPLVGELVEDLELQYQDSSVFHGEGRIVHLVERPELRLGIQFTRGLLDVAELRIRDRLIEQRLESELDQIERENELLPIEWRAGVAMLYQMLERARVVMAEIEISGGREGWWRDPRRCRAVCEQFYRRWNPPYRALCEKLERMTHHYGPELVKIGLRYAQRQLMQTLHVCPMHGRAYEKPRGYAGDYRLMELGQAEELEGDSLYARFLHHVAQNYSLGRTIVQRGFTAHDAAAELLAQGRPLRIASLACGPAIELRYLLRGIEGLDQPLEILLIDQDAEALDRCQQELTRIIQNHPAAPLPIQLHCLHFSLRQIIAPKRGEETQLVETVLRNLDLVYSMGLFDYILQPLARRLVTTLAQTLAPGGRLLIGNLERVADSSWLMEFGTAWQLVYREEDSMLDLASEVEGAASKKVTRDATGHCLFLDIVRA